MNHPTPEELAAFVCADLQPEQHEALASHLGGCPQCHGQVEQWRRVRQELNQWQLAEPAAGSPAVRPVASVRRPLAWAIAAAAMFVVGFAAARWNQPRVEDLRTNLAAELRKELRAELSRHETELSTRQASYQEALTKAIGRLEARRLIDYAGLRQDLEEVAASAEDEINNTRQELLRLSTQNP